MSPNKDIRIVLTGFMGVGKSTVARHLAQLADAKKVDLDQALESFEKRAVAEIIDELGIQEFRRIETSALARVLADPGVRILSLGGGTWTMLENRELIRESGFTSVWL